ncbi:MAG: symmetrical bis(5'-nucleosyl)-tetraphosphatase [Pseudomonadales bacterium]
MSVWAIGDIQGCVEPLQNLLHSISFKSDRDQLWIAGDLVNRGPASLDVLRLLYALRDNCTIVLGNHDLHLLAVASGERPVGRKDTFSDVLNAADREPLLEWLQRQKLMHIDSKRKMLMVHAGIPPIWNIEQAEGYAMEVEKILVSSSASEFFANMYGDDSTMSVSTEKPMDRLRQITNYFTRMRFCTEKGVLDLADKSSVTSERPGYKPWFEYTNSLPKDFQIVFGHWAALEGRTTNNSVHALDTGCVWGACLTAFDLDSRQRKSCQC